MIGDGHAIEQAGAVGKDVGVPLQQPLADGGGGAELAGLHVMVHQPDARRPARIGHEISRKYLLEREQVISLGLFQQRRCGGFESGAVDIEPFLRPAAQPLHDQFFNAGVLIDAVPGIFERGYDFLGELRAAEQFLIEIGGLAPFLLPLHFLGFGQFVHRVDGLRRVDAFGGVLGVEVLGIDCAAAIDDVDALGDELSAGRSRGQGGQGNGGQLYASRYKPAPS